MPLDLVTLTRGCKAPEAVLRLRLWCAVLGIGLGVEGGTQFLCHLIAEFLELAKQAGEFVLLLGFRRMGLLLLLRGRVWLGLGGTLGLVGLVRSLRRGTGRLVPGIGQSDQVQATSFTYIVVAGGLGLLRLLSLLGRALLRLVRLVGLLELLESVTQTPGGVSGRGSPGGALVILAIGQVVFGAGHDTVGHKNKKVRREEV